MTTKLRAFRISPWALGLTAALTGVACGPEQPPAPGAYAAATPRAEAPAARQDLPANAYQIEWGLVLVPATLKPGERVDVAVTVKNISPVSWPATGKGELYVVRLAHRWMRPDGQMVADYGARRAELPGPVAPGASASLNLPLVAPSVPGDYLVQLDLVHEGVAWFANRGAAKKVVTVKVQ